MALRILLNRLVGDRRGTSAIEFALLTPFLAMLAVGISDLAQGLTRKYQLEQASYRALELMTVGSLQSDYQAFVRPEAATASGEPIGNVTVNNWLECDGVKAASFGLTCTTGQQTARFVQVTIVSDFQPSFAYTADLLGGANGKIRLTARSTLRVQ